MSKTLMQVLGETLGTKFAKITEVFARKGNVSVEFDTLEKLEGLIKRLNSAVFEGSAENELDTLAEVSAFLNENRDKILAASEHIEVVNDLVTADTGKALSAAQGMVLKDAVDGVSAAVSGCLQSAKGYTDEQIRGVTNSLAALSTALSGKADVVAVYTKTEMGTVEEFTASFSGAAGDIFK